MGCFYDRDQQCLRKVALPELVGELDATPGFLEGIQERLGGRQAAILNRSMSINTYKGTKGNRTTVRISLAVQYERDPNAGESYVLVNEGNGFRVASFKVTSKRLFEDVGQ